MLVSVLSGIWWHEWLDSHSPTSHQPRQALGQRTGWKHTIATQGQSRGSAKRRGNCRVGVMGGGGPDPKEAGANCLPFLALVGVLAHPTPTRDWTRSCSSHSPQGPARFPMSSRVVCTQTLSQGDDGEGGSRCWLDPASCLVPLSAGMVLTPRAVLSGTVSPKGLPF